jgi:hypothetical protein
MTWPERVFGNLDCSALADFGDNATGGQNDGTYQWSRGFIESQTADNRRWIITAYGADRPVTYFRGHWI